jgi:hypothetical protein
MMSKEAHCKYPKCSYPCPDLPDCRDAEQPAQQEPVAFLVDGDLYYPEEIDWETLQEQGHTVTPLYTSPPAQRTWVGLTDEDVYPLANEHLHYQPESYEVSGIYNLARAIEARLKEKNNG